MRNVNAGLHNTAVGIGTFGGEVLVDVTAFGVWSEQLAHMDPAQARSLAAALLRAADEAEGKPSDTLGSYRDAIEARVRADVAADLDAMDGTNLGMSLVRQQAINVARNGLRPCDVQREGK